jgi:hypothetical protein
MYLGSRNDRIDRSQEGALPEALKVPENRLPAFDWLPAMAMTS